MRRQPIQDSCPARNESQPRARRRIQADRRAASADDPETAQRQRRDVHAGAGHRHQRELARQLDASRAPRTLPSMRWNRVDQSAVVPAA